MEEYPYTSFPTLDYSEGATGPATADWSCTIGGLELDVLILSWATVLKALTDDESPVFHLDGEPVRVDLEERTFTRVRTNNPGKPAYTGICTSGAVRFVDGCVLEVHCSLEQGNGQIISSGSISSSYLAQIRVYFESTICLSLGIPPTLDAVQPSILNADPHIYSGPLLLHDLVANRASDLALDFLDKNRKRHSLTYDQFHTSASQLSARILNSSKSRRATPQVIPVLIPQASSLYITWLAVLKAGATVCPLGVDTPPERIGYIVRDVDAEIVVTVKSLAEKFSSAGRSLIVLSVDDDAEDTVNEPTENTPQVQPDGLAYVMYTSGSTGMPKGVGISHRAATQALLAHDEHLPPFKRFLQFASPTFDVSVFEIFFPLFRGATLVACDRNLMLNDLVGIMNELKVDCAELTPTVAGELLRRKVNVPSLKILLTIGEMLTRTVIDEFGFSNVGEELLYAMYGPTEATIHCTIAPKLPNGSRVGNIGVPLKSVSAFVIKIQEQIEGEPHILPVGCIGELAVGGPQLANGYLNRPEENKKAFIDSAKYGRLYRTGDKVRLHPTGELECLGRISSGQVKLRGQRMELGEVESIIFKTPGVRNVVAAIISGVLVAFVTGDTVPDSQHSIRRVCETLLPKFMVPSDIVLMEELPRLPSGKIDRKLLEKNYLEAEEDREDDDMPHQSDTERKISACVKTVLQGKVKPSSSLAGLGLDSLKAIRLASLLRGNSINLDVFEILEADSIQQIMALEVEKSAKQIPAPSFSSGLGEPIRRATCDALASMGCSSLPLDIVSCSPIQISMVAESMRKERAYSNWIELDFGQNSSTAEIQNALRSVAQKNEILRSGFVETGVPEQPYTQLIWDKVDDNAFIECDTFDYGVMFRDPQQMLNPIRVQLKAVNDHIKALIHIHHALYDGWSLELILEDLEEYLSYNSCTARPQYRDFVDYTLAFLSSPLKTDGLNYWRDHLRGVSPSPWPIFQDHSNIPPKCTTLHHDFNLDLDQIDAVVQSFLLSRQTVFQGALGYLLGQYQGTSDVCFGSVSSGRTVPLEGIEHMIGPCINTLPIRLNLEAPRNARDLLSKIHTLNRKSLVHGLIPLRDIKSVSGIDPSGSLFDTLFIWQETGNEAPKSGGSIKQVASADFLEFTLTLEIEIDNHRLHAKATFQESVLPTSQVRFFLRQLDEVASLFVRKPEIHLGDVNGELPISVLSAENIEFSSCANSPSLFETVKKTAAVDPERIALQFLDVFSPDLSVNCTQNVSYASLVDQANELAERLRCFGIGPGSLVSIFLEKSPGLYISILAVIAAGAGYVPITPQTPSKRIDHIISETSCRVCITSPDLLDSVAPLGDMVILDPKANLLRESKRLPDTQLEKKPTVAYVIFTSGSTGVPKGVSVSHDNMLENIAVLSEIYPIGPNSKMLQACSHAFDVSVFEIFFTWAMGMTLCSATNDVLFRDIEGAIRVLGITHLSLTPSVASLISPRNVPQVQFLVTSGEALTMGVLKEWANVGVYQGYGPCETTNICTVRPRVQLVDFLSNIGKPFKNTSAFVLAEGNNSSLLPRGAVGEFCFGGHQVALGYLNLPDLTEQKFLEHPKFGRIYRSGDFGRMLPDGSLAFAGRRDDMVKLRGQRVELGEINSAILKEEIAKNCSTLVCKDKSTGIQLLVSFCVLALDAGANDGDLVAAAASLFTRISGILPRYMVPSFILPVDAIPMTVNGKVDKSVLLEIFDRASPEYLASYSTNAEMLGGAEELSGVELQIANVVSTLTKVPLNSIGRHSSFFGLGMDSILAISFSRELRKARLGQVDVSAIMKNDTISRLNMVLSDHKNSGSTEKDKLPIFKSLFPPEFVLQVKDEVDCSQKKLRKILPCTPLQEAMLSQSMSNGLDSYFNHLTFEILGDVTKLKSAWQAMVARHDILRTCFRSTNDSRFAFAQIVLESAALPWSATECANAEIGAEIERQKSSISVMDGVALPYAFIELRNSTTGTSMLHLLIHHALYDGEAMTCLLLEVEKTFNQSSLPPVVPFDYFIEQMIETDVDAADEFWNRHLSGFSPVYLVPHQNQNTPIVRENAFHSRDVYFDISLSQATEMCKNASSTLLSVLQASWAKLICFYTGLSDVCFGDVSSCRTLPIDNAEQIVGPCFNTLPLRVKLDSNTINEDLLLQLRNIRANALPYQLVSLRRLQARFSPHGSKLFDTLLLLQKPPEELDESIWKLVDESGAMDFPFICEIVPHSKQDLIQFQLHCDGSKASAKELGQLLEGFMESIRHTLEYPGARAMDDTVLKAGVPAFLNISRPDIQRKSEEDGSLEWSAEALQVRKLVSALVKIDEETLKPQTTIYKLGLDSINAIQIASELRKSGYEVSASNILEASTLAGIGSCLTKRPTDEKIDTVNLGSFQASHWSAVCQEVGPELGPNIESVLPCTPVQAGILALFINSGGNTYLNHTTLRSIEPLDIPALKDAWQAVIERNEILRTGFCHVKDESHPFAMIVYKAGTFGIPWHETLAEEEIDYSSDAQLLTKISERLYRPAWFLTVQTHSSHTVILFSAIHALYDAHSLNLMLSEVSRLYKGRILPQPIPISPVVASILAKSTKKEERLEKFWKDLCTNISGSKFPDLNPVRAHKQETSVATKTCSKLLSAINEGCAEAEITLQAAGQAAWARLLASYTGETDVTFGLVLSGRSLSPASQDTLFPCLTTIPSRYNIKGSNRDLVREIMKSNSFLIDGQYTPLSRLKRMAGADTVLFDTLFAYQKFGPTSEDEQIWTVVDERAVTENLVSVELIPKYDELEFCLTFRNDILPVEQAHLLLRQLDWLLLDSIFSPGSHCEHFIEAHSDLTAVIPRKDNYIESPVELLHQFVELRARQHPDKTALEFASKLPGSDDRLTVTSWSYKDLNGQGNRYANALLQLGASSSPLIGICFDKCPEAYFAILAILKIGSAYVAIDPGAPTARKQFIMEDSGSTFILCTSDRKSELMGIAGVRVIALDNEEVFANAPDVDPILKSPIRGEDTCYCLYTSGSTGTPKGCEITHDNAVQSLLAFRRLFTGHWDDTSRWLQFASFHFDVSVLEQYCSWNMGICLTSCPRDVLFEDLPGTIKQLGITHIDLTPSLARLLHPDDVPSLCRGIFITGGEALKQEILDAWGEKQVIYNFYGPTEVTIGCTVLPRATSQDKPSNIGLQFDNVSSFVLKPNTNLPVLRGGIGELCVSGPLVGHGYLNRPQLTEERFRYIAEYGERVYRTGDLVRLLHDESFSFLGRIDDQVKLRGQRLEIDEINHVIRSSAQSIRDLVTMVLNHPTAGKEQLVSFITLNETFSKNADVAIDTSSLASKVIDTVRKTCRLKLPDYMIPTRIIPLIRLPLSQNNKIENKQLKEIYAKQGLEEVQAVAAEGEEIKKIITIISNFAGYDEKEVSQWSNIFQLGLDSISVISLARLLKEAGFVAARPALVMKKPVISALSEKLNLAGQEDKSRLCVYKEAKQSLAAFSHQLLGQLATDLQVPIDALEAVSPCTPLQHGMIYGCLEMRGAYLSHFVFELLPNVDASKLLEAWRKTQSTIQILRTKFPVTMDGYAQVVMKHDDFPWFELVIGNEEELADVSRARYESWVSALDTFIGRVWEVGVISTPTRNLMCLNIFHGLYDGNSLELLLEHVARAYSELDEKTVPSFMEILPFGPLCKQPGAELFWTQHLKSAEVRTLPVSDTQESKVHTQSIKIRVSDSLQQLRRRLNVTDQAIIHACWLNVFKRHFGYNPTLGIVVSGRVLEVDGAENVIGPLFNTVPVFVASSGMKSMSDLVRACHDFHTAVLPFQHTPLRDIMKWLGRNAGDPLFDSLFVFQKRFGNANRLSDSLWASSDSYAEAYYPLAFEAEDQGDGTLSISIVSRDNVFSPQSSETLIHQFEDLLLQYLGDQSLTLHSSGDFIIERPESSRENINKNGDEPENLEPLAGKCPVFEWNSKAETLRDEIARLANTNKESVNETTSIFELGLDSIDAIRLSTRLKNRGLTLSVSKIMHCRNIKAMVNEVTGDFNVDKDSSDHLRNLENILRASLQANGMALSHIESILPATPLQEGLLAQMIASDYRLYFNHDSLEIEKGVDLEKLRDALRKTIKENPILRTSFIQLSDPNLPFSFAQLVHPARQYEDMIIVDVAEATIDTIFEEERQRAMRNDTRSPLFRLRLLRDNSKILLCISIAHALYDGWSLDLLHQSIAKNYLGEKCDHPSYRPLLGRIISSANNQEASQFWKGYLDGIRPIPFSSQNEPTNPKIYREEKEVKISFSEVAAFCRRQGMSPLALGLTSWMLVLASHLRQLDVVFGTVLSGRDTAEAERMMFPAMNTVAIRGILHGSFKDMLQYIQGMLGNILEHQHFPLNKVKALSGIGGESLFDTLFIFQKRQSGENTSLYKSVQSFSDVEYPVCADLEVSGDSIFWRVACKGPEWDHLKTINFLERVIHCFTHIISSPDRQTVEFTGDKATICGVTFVPAALEKMETSSTMVNGHSSTEPWTALESDIRSVLAMVSNIPEADITKSTTLFHLGLDSISAIKVSSLLKKRSIALAVSDMVRAGTITKMAQAATIRQGNKEIQDPKSIYSKSLEAINLKDLLSYHKISSETVEDIIPATAGQIYMIEISKRSNGAIFFQTFFYRLQGNITPEMLEQSWNKTTQQLAILRTKFIQTGFIDIPYVQVVSKTDENPVIWQPDLRNRSNLQYQSKSRLVTLFAAQTELGITLALRIHHALYDAVSLEQVMSIICTRCNGGAIPRYMQMAHFAAFNTINSSTANRKVFWKAYIARADARSREPPMESLERSGLTQNYSPSLIEDIGKLDKFGREQGVSIQSLFLAVYAKVHKNLLSGPMLSDTEDLIIGIYLANRSHAMEGLPTLAGPTVNIVPLCINSPRARTVIELAKSIQSDIHEISSAQNSCVSLVEIEQWTGVTVDTVVNFLKYPQPTDPSDSEEISFVPIQETEISEGVSNGGTINSATNGKPEEALAGLNASLNSNPSSTNGTENLNKAYKTSIDIEAAIRNNSLDVGIFGSDSRVDEALSHTILEELKRELTSI